MFERLARLRHPRPSIKPSTYIRTNGPPHQPTFPKHHQAENTQHVHASLHTWTQ